MADERERRIDRAWATIPRAEYDELWRKAGNWDEHVAVARSRHDLAALPLPADYDHAAMLALGDGPATPYAPPASHDAPPAPPPAPPRRKGRAPAATAQRGLFDDDNGG